jgi:hypothetical protein
MSGAQARAVIAAGADLVRPEVGRTHRRIGLANRPGAHGEERKQIEGRSGAASVICSVALNSPPRRRLKRLSRRFLQGGPRPRILADF